MTGTVYRLRPRTARVRTGDALLLRLGARKMKISVFGAAEQVVIMHLVAGGTVEQLETRLTDDFDAAACDRARRVLAALLERGFLESDCDTDHLGLDPQDIERFSRLTDFLSDYEDDDKSRNQYLAKLRAATVAVIGLGGLGSWVTYQLMCIGVGRLVLIDPDEVGLSNLNRSILFGEGDVGQMKVDAAERTIRRFAPRTEVVRVCRAASSADDLSPIVRDASFVIGTADKPHWRIREWIARACRDAGIASVQAGGGRVGPFHVPGRTSCMMCYFAHERRRNPKAAAAMRADDLGGQSPGSFAPLGATAGAVIGHEAFRYLSGVGTPLTMLRAWELNPADLTARYVAVPIADDCPVCGTGPSLDSERG